MLTTLSVTEAPSTPQLTLALEAEKGLLPYPISPPASVTAPRTSSTVPTSSSVTIEGSTATSQVSIDEKFLGAISDKDQNIRALYSKEVRHRCNERP